MKLTMDLLHLFRSLLPIHNPIGFGVSDFVEFGFALLLVVLLLTRARLEPAARRLAERTGWSMLALGALVVLLRLALLPLPAFRRYLGPFPAGQSNAPAAPVL